VTRQADDEAVAQLRDFEAGLQNSPGMERELSMRELYMRELSMPDPLDPDADDDAARRGSVPNAPPVSNHVVVVRRTAAGFT
jgi:hypothetical protein